MMKITLACLSLFWASSSVNAQAVEDNFVPPVIDDYYDHTNKGNNKLAGSDSCALIKIVLDETWEGTGDTTTPYEAEWMKLHGVPGIIDELKDKVDHTFVCIHGFGNQNHDDQIADVDQDHQVGHFHGCTGVESVAGTDDVTVTDSTIFDTWKSEGSQHDGWQAIHYAIRDTPSTIDSKNLYSTCGKMYKNMILVTKNHRDENSITNTNNGKIIEEWTRESTVQQLADAGFKLNVVSELIFGPGWMTYSWNNHPNYEEWLPYNMIQNYAVGLTYDMRIIASEATTNPTYTDSEYFGDSYPTSNSDYKVQEFDFSGLENETEAMDLVHVWYDGAPHPIRDDYAFVAFATGGAAWNIKHVLEAEADPTARGPVAFLAGFEKIKAQELVPDTTDPPTTSPGGSGAETCKEQARCMSFEVTKQEKKCTGDHNCEYRVCWNQNEKGVTTSVVDSGEGNGECAKDGTYSHVGDIFKDSPTDDTYCMNEMDERMSFWDPECQEPTGLFSVCQDVPAGATAHFLAKDGAGCKSDGEVWDGVAGPYTATLGEKKTETSHGLTATCTPSSSQMTSYMGKTFFQNEQNTGKGTCSGNAESIECIWTVTVPNDCDGEDGCIVNDNADNFVCSKGGVLSYYPHHKNGPPPKNPIVDLSFDAKAETVNFRVLNPFDDELHDIYVVSDDPARPEAFGDTVCHLEPDAGKCPSKDLITAKCIDDNSYTVVTIYASGKGQDSAAAQMAIVKNELHKCCPLQEPAYTPEWTAAWTYVIHCNCNEALARRGLRGKTKA